MLSCAKFKQMTPSINTKPDLVGIAEISEMAGTSKQAITNWRMRYDSFPRPVHDLQSGPIWEREKVDIWIKSFRSEETHVLSVINLKGGVGKTTVAVALAEFLAEEERKHVLLVDLDPQTNATVTLIKEELWEKMDNEGRTVAQLFLDKLNPKDPPKFSIEEAIVHGVSTINDGIARLDLLPSSIQLIDIQDEIPFIGFKGNFTVNPLEILKIALQPVIERYDYIIIDCPPSLGTVTKNGLRISTGYIIPTIPDIVSTWGIYQIVDNVDKFAKELDRQKIPALGIVATKVQSNNLHNRIIEDLRYGRLGKFGESSLFKQPPLFKSIIPQTVAVARGAEVDADLRTFKGKYGAAHEHFRSLTKEINQICEAKKV
jgi:chromosome partitioning protein